MNQTFSLDRNTQRAADRIRRAITALISAQPFVGITAIHMLPAIPDTERHSVAADGLNLRYNPRWITKATGSQITQAVAHCVIACALKHHTRRADRSYNRWQRASREVTQHILLKQGLADPEHGTGMDLSIVQVYNRLPPEPDPPPPPQPSKVSSQSDPQPQQQDHPNSQDHQNQPDDQNGTSDDGQQSQANQNGSTPDHPSSGPTANQPGSSPDQGSPQPLQDDQSGPRPPGNYPQPPSTGNNPPDSGNAEGGEAPPDEPTQSDDRGEVMDHPAPNDQASRAEELRWDDITHQAITMAKGQGKEPGNLSELISRSHAPSIDWRTSLQEFISEFAPSQRGWTNIDRRFVAKGLFLPGPHKDSVPNICFAIDTSASLTHHNLARVWNEIRECADILAPDTIRIIQCDAAVQEDTTHIGSDLPEELTAKGRRGTAYQPVFRLLEQEPPEFLIYLTDLDCNDYPQREPDYPVLWICTDPYYTGQPTFGERIDLPPTEGNHS